MAERKPQGVTITFTEDEFDVVIAGLAMLVHSVDGDAELADRAALVLDRINTALPEEPVPALKPRKGDGPYHGTIRQAIQAETKLTLRYVDRKEKESRRVIWPLELGFVGAGETIGAWCETRHDFRHFRLDRIVALEDTSERYPRRRRILLAQLRADEIEQGW